MTVGDTVGDNETSSPKRVRSSLSDLGLVPTFDILVYQPLPHSTRVKRRGNTGALLKSFLRRFVRLHGMIFSGRADVSPDNYSGNNDPELFTHIRCPHGQVPSALVHRARTVAAAQFACAFVGTFGRTFIVTLKAGEMPMRCALLLRWKHKPRTTM